MLVLSSNDYLGLSVHPLVRRAAADAATRLGVGSTGSRHLAGNHDAIGDLEDSLADFEETDTATLAPSGWAANMAAVAALGGPDAIVLCDSRNHASLVDGCRASRSAVEMYRHRDLDHLESRLRRASGRPVIVSDTVFSMDGTVADVGGLAELARRHDAWMILDEAHATGVVGPEGRGAACAAGLTSTDDYAVRVVTFSKALGASGGAVCGSSSLRRLLFQRGRALIFSTALPHPIVAAAAAALGVLRRQPELVETLRARAGTLRGELAQRELIAEFPPEGPPQAPPDMPIVPVLVGDPQRAVKAEEALWRDGYLAQAVRPPSVPRGTSRLRLVASVLHGDGELTGAAGAVAAALR